MATPADRRLLDLLDKWLKSLELHLQYAALDADQYARIQPWPEHQRPSRWIVDLAKQKALALQAQIQERVDAGDAKFADGLELMAFLANLLGAEHIERFIPLANANPREATDSAPQDGASATREMPALADARPRSKTPVSTAAVARTERAPAPAAAAVPGPVPASGKGVVASETVKDLVIADAARLVQWGRKWYELAELISAMADRPTLIDVRRILKDNKAVIDKKAGRG